MSQDDFLSDCTALLLWYGSCEGPQLLCPVQPVWEDPALVQFPERSLHCSQCKEAQGLFGEYDLPMCGWGCHRPGAKVVFPICVPLRLTHGAKRTAM